MSPLLDYVLIGTCYKSYIEGRVEVFVTIGTGGGGSQDIFIVSDGILAKSQTLTIYNYTEDSKLEQPYEITTSATTGTYLLSCNNLPTGWSAGDVLLIIGSTITATLHKSENGDDEVITDPIQARRRLLVDKEGSEIGTENPLPVHITTETLDFLNAKKVLTKGGPNGRLSQIDWYYKGRHYRQTIIHSGNTETHNAMVEV